MFIPLCKEGHMSQESWGGALGNHVSSVMLLHFMHVEFIFIFKGLVFTFPLYNTLFVALTEVTAWFLQYLPGEEAVFSFLLFHVYLADLAENSLLNKLIRKSLVESSHRVEVLQRDPSSPLFSVKTFEELHLWVLRQIRTKASLDWWWLLTLGCGGRVGNML